MDYTNVLQLYKDFCEDFKDTLLEESLLGQEPWHSLLIQAEEINTLLSDNTITGELDNYKLTQANPIESLGVGNSVIALYEENYTTEDITTILNNQGFDLEVKDVKEWLKTYNKEGILTKASFNYGSVFDTQVQLQTLFESLNDMLLEIKHKPDSSYKRKDKDDIIREYLAELRQAIREAAQLTSTVASIKKAEEFQQIVLEEINKESPMVAAKIINRISQLKNVIKTLDL